MQIHSPYMAQNHFPRSLSLVQDQFQYKLIDTETCKYTTIQALHTSTSQYISIQGDHTRYIHIRVYTFLIHTYIH